MEHCSRLLIEVICGELQVPLINEVNIQSNRKCEKSQTKEFIPKNHHHQGNATGGVPCVCALPCTLRTPPKISSRLRWDVRSIDDVARKSMPLLFVHRDLGVAIMPNELLSHVSACERRCTLPLPSCRCRPGYPGYPPHHGPSTTEREQRADAHEQRAARRRKPPVGSRCPSPPKSYRFPPDGYPPWV